MSSSPQHPHVRNPQQPSRMPIHRYAPFTPVVLADRTWPETITTKAPRTTSTTKGTTRMAHTSTLITATASSGRT